MKPEQIAAQLYTVRDLCRTPAGIAAALKQIAAIGYRAVEIAGIGPFDAAQIRTMTEEAGLGICAFHDGIAALVDQPARSAERATILGCDLVVSSYPTDYDLAKEEDVRRLGAALAAAGTAYRAAGKTFCYHHHSVEFQRFGQRTVLDFLLANVPAEQMSLELDTYWIQHGGGDSAAWCRRLAGRMPIMHLKDYASTLGVPTMAEVGRGNLAWPEILAAAEASGCRWFVVEQDICPGDPLDSLRASYDHLRKHFPG